MNKFEFALLACLLVAGCSAAQVQTAQTGLAQAGIIINTVACDAQAAANLAGTAAGAAGDANVAAEASAVSKAAGSLCMQPAQAAAASPAP